MNFNANCNKQRWHRIASGLTGQFLRSDLFEEVLSKLIKLSHEIKPGKLSWKESLSEDYKNF